MLVRMIRGMAVSAGAALGLAMIVPAAAHAQAQTAGTRFGIEADYGSQHIGFGVGAFVKFHLADISAHPITGRASFDYFFPGNSFCGFANCGYKYFEISGDGLFDIATENAKVKPYVGAGLTWSHESFGADFCDFGGCPSGSSFGLDVVGGINFMGNSKLMPFVEAKFDLRGNGAFIIKGGIHF